MRLKHRPLVLIVLDGWGYSENTLGNAIHAARTPVWDEIWNKFPHTLIRCAGADVGLPAGQMGNSEVGHLNMGAGRVVYQELTRINRSIKTGSFFTNSTLTGAVDAVIQSGKALHIFGLLSPGGVHSHEEHIQATIKLAVERGARRVYLHAFLDGRDTPPRSAEASLRTVEQQFTELGSGQVASIIGRYFAMDRDYRWDRVQTAYDLLAEGAAEFQAPDALTGLKMAYERGENDEFVKATAITGADGKPVKMADGDVVIFMNFRSDRARQLTKAFIEQDFKGFERRYVPKLASFVSLAEYNKEFFYVPVAFPAERLSNVFGEYVAKLGLRQLRIAETEKYAHVTFFFNGGVEHPYEWEDRILVPSPKVPTYDQQPAMSAPEVTDRLIGAVESGQYDVIICNYANADMVGHTGKFDAAVAAIEALDQCLGRVIAATRKAGGEILITADHGNAEQMADEQTQQAHTAHTSNPVPFIYIGRPAVMSPSGALSDVAPTMLYLMKLKQPAEMNGESLVIVNQ